MYWIMQTEGFSLYIGAATSAMFIIIGALILAIPDTLRNMILAVGAMEDKWARILFALDASFGVLLIILAL